MVSLGYNVLSISDQRPALEGPQRIIDFDPPHVDCIFNFRDRLSGG